MSRLTIRTRSGACRIVDSAVDAETIVGLDPDGRLVVDTFGDAFHPDRRKIEQSTPFLFGLTLCCNAYDKGGECDVYCRACYGGAANADAGAYLYMAADGTYPGFDPAVSVVSGTEGEFAPTIPDDAVSASSVPEAGHPTAYRVTLPETDSAEVAASLARQSDFYAALGGFRPDAGPDAD
jgi:hypothetical protein